MIVLNEALAAAIGAGLPVSDPVGNMVVDTQHYTVLRLVGYAHLHLSLTAHILCKSVQHGSAAGQRVR